MIHSAPFFLSTFNQPTNPTNSETRTARRSSSSAGLARAWTVCVQKHREPLVATRHPRTVQKVFARVDAARTKQRSNVVVVVASAHSVDVAAPTSIGTHVEQSQHVSVAVEKEMRQKTKNKKEKGRKEREETKKGDHCMCFDFEYKMTALLNSTLFLSS